MVAVADTVTVVRPPELLDVPTKHGRLAVAITTSPDATVPSPLMRCCIVLASWRDATDRASMFITFLQLPGEPVRSVNLVYADLGFRKERTADGSTTAAVAVGKFLFATRLLHQHSVHRTDSGDRWAQEVGGVLPQRLPPLTDFDSEHVGAQMLAMINRCDLPPFPTI